ncbi:MAG: phosphoribosylaminoimidazolesuccinocarboxamide synthase [Patescibacteria group bacterium]
MSIGINGIRETNFNFAKKVKVGKVRDIYELEDGKLLIIATDRISAFDVILEDIIPHKGIILTKLTLFWLELLKGIVPNHLITGNFKDFPKEVQHLVIKDRAMIVKRLKPLPVEMIVRGYLSGSGWKEYQKNQSVCGIKLPAGLKESDKLPEVIFTPSTKAESGAHDVNLSFEEYTKILERSLGPNFGKYLASLIRIKSVELYNKAAAYALSRGIIIADTKLEFAVDENYKLIIIDEMFTPDSSRFWSIDKYEPGKSQDSLDKQFVRDYLERVGWDKKPPAPKLPQDVINDTQRRYFDILNILTSACI